jgi:hypothetical protein
VPAFPELYHSSQFMSYSNFRLILSFIIFLFVSACSPSKKAASSLVPTNIKSLHLLGEYDIPHNLEFNHTTVGGLSGIDYDSKNDVYIMVSDDRSAINPARFYTAKIFFTAKGIDSLRFLEVKNMLRADGQVYPNNQQDALHVPDPEAMRYNPVTGQFVWSSEGERIVTPKDTILENPSVIFISREGKYIDSIPLPGNLAMSAMEKGPRQNSVLEGLTFADQFKTLFVSVEEPLYQDGPRADTFENAAYIRIYKFNASSKQNTAQYAYRLDPVAHAAIPVNGFKINGIPDILSSGKDQLLVIERSFSTGRLACTIRVFKTDLKDASDISGIESLKAATGFRPAGKELLLDMDSLGIYIDNIEGMTWGPVLANGKRTILFIADNNFSPLEQSQVLLFEVNE